MAQEICPDCKGYGYNLKTLKPCDCQQVATAQHAPGGAPSGYVVICTVIDDDGEVVRVFVSTRSEKIHKELASWCRKRWDRNNLKGDPDMISDAEVIYSFFEKTDYRQYWDDDARIL